MYISFEKAVSDIIKAGNRLDAMQLAPATSGNYSMRTGEDEMAITVSGAHKGQLQPSQIMRAKLDGTPIDDKKPSAETLLHCVLYKMFPDCNAILHTHSVANTVLTRFMDRAEYLELSGYEMLKAYNGVETHNCSVRLPIFDNTQDMNDLSIRVEEMLQKNPNIPAYMIRAHGIYGWGKDMAEAERVIEATEMMLSCELNMKQIKGAV
ncbi:MAG: methylthioribulose 1-phosphate dehydratase [Alphaproteobacteria bacterium]